jgi:hypothetical protein
MSPALVILALAVAGFVGLCIAHPVIWRHFSGAAYDGKPRTDRGLFTPATKVLTVTGRASRLHHGPRIKHAAWRTVPTLAALAALCGLLMARTLTLWSLAAAGLGGLIWGAWRTRRAILAWAHHRAWVRPLHLALAPALGVPLATRPASWLTVPRNFADDDQAQVRVRLPDHFVGSPDARRLVVETVQAKLGLEDVRPAFHLTGSPYLALTTSVPPPDKVGLADVREIIADLPESEPLIGLGRKSAPVGFDLAADSPHCLISGGSGSGKSVLARFLMAQGSRNGGIFLVLDVKRNSHRWAKGLPNVHYCRSIAEIHDALIWCQSEIDRRNDIVDEFSDDNGDLPDNVDIGPRFWLICEEMNATANRLGAYWRKIKPQDAPAVSPAIEALNDFLFMGRAVKMNAIAIAQMMTARTLGGPEARENFAFRCLARYSVNAWRMLCPEVWPMPKMNRHTGRWQIVTGGQAREVQVGFMSAAEARGWALSGTVATFPDMTTAEPATTGRTPLHLVEPLVSATSEPGPIGLAEACRSGVLSLTLAAAKTARARDPEFPQPANRRGNGRTAEALYNPADLRAWEGNREQSA